MFDGFELSEDLLEEEAGEALSFETGPIDVENPGFATLLTALQGVRAGEVGPEVLWRYHAALTEHLLESRARLQSISIPEALQALLAPALEATSATMDRMQAVLDLTAEHLAGRAGALEQAVELLESIHHEMRQVLEQVR